MLLMQLKCCRSQLTLTVFYGDRDGELGVLLGDEAQDRPAQPLGHNERRLWQEQISNR